MTGQSSSLVFYMRPSPLVSNFLSLCGFYQVYQFLCAIFPVWCNSASNESVLRHLAKVFTSTSYQVVQYICPHLKPEEKLNF